MKDFYLLSNRVILVKHLEYVYKEIRKTGSAAYFFMCGEGEQNVRKYSENDQINCSFEEIIFNFVSTQQFSE